MASGHNVQQVFPFLSFPFLPPRIRNFASLLEQRVPATLSQCQCRRLAAVARRAGDARALLSILRHVYDRHCTAKRDELSTPSSKLNTRGSMGMHCVTQPPLAPGPSSTLEFYGGTYNRQVARNCVAQGLVRGQWRGEGRRFKMRYHSSLDPSGRRVLPPLQTV